MGRGSWGQEHMASGGQGVPDKEHTASGGQGVPGSGAHDQRWAGGPGIKST